MKLTILTVDDSRTIQDLLRLVLTDAGMDVVQADDGQHGIEVLNQCRPHVIVTDINMPRLDGFGFISAVRATPRLERTPILVLTTENDDTKKDRARKAGATGWITKPFAPDKLVAAVQRVAMP